MSWLAGHGEYRINPAWILNAGAMLEYSSLSAAWLFLPRLSVHYHWDDQQTLRVAYSTGSRQPTLYENNGRAIIRGVNVPLTIYGAYASGGLNPEINRSIELGYHWQPSRSASLDFRLFQEPMVRTVLGFVCVDGRCIGCINGSDSFQVGTGLMMP